MIFQSPFSNKNFSDLRPGDFFFHPLSGEYSPAIKVVRADGHDGIVDLNMGHQHGGRFPTLVNSEGFDTVALVAVQTAFLRPKPGLRTLKNGGVNAIDRSALVISPTQTLLRVRGPNLAILAFDISTGLQASLPHDTQCLWTAEWQVVIIENDKEQVLFDHSSSLPPS